LGSSNEDIKSVLARRRARADHLAWSANAWRARRPTESAQPLWYAGSLALGYAAGRLGERWNLDSRETERQVEAALARTYRIGSEAATPRRWAVIDGMQREEGWTSAHGRGARARDLPHLQAWHARGRALDDNAIALDLAPQLNRARIS